MKDTVVDMWVLLVVGVDRLPSLSEPQFPLDLVRLMRTQENYLTQYLVTFSCHWVNIRLNLNPCLP